MSIRKTLVRKVVSIGLCALIGFAGLALGQASDVSAAQAKTTKVDKVIQLGKKYLGVRYRFGAPSGATSAFDCSSFTQYIFGKNGIKLPRVSSSQALKGKKITYTKLKKGDLVFFKSPRRTGKKIGHVGVYLGNHKIMHSSPKLGVAVSSLTGYWKTNYVTARRVL